MEELRLACVDLDIPPLFIRSGDGARTGYEPAVAQLVGEALGRSIVWQPRVFLEMVPSMIAGQTDAVLCVQGITDERREIVDFTRPYAISDEAVLVRSGSGITEPADLVGLKVAAGTGTTNIEVAETFEGAQVVPYDSAAPDVLERILTDMRTGAVDAFVDDDIIVYDLATDPAFESGFSVPTQNRFGFAVAKHRPELRDQLDQALASVIADGRLRGAWEQWIPDLPFPLAD